MNNLKVQMVRFEKYYKENIDYFKFKSPTLTYLKTEHKKMMLVSAENSA